jgi:thiamine-monophosphate kinase
MFGHVAPGAAWRRGGAQAGDGLFVTGIIGRGVLGLRALRGEVADPDGALASHYRLPEPRLNLGLQGLVHAAIDLSDGLVQDAGHIARASGLALVLEPALVPLCAAGRAAGPDFVTSGAAGGDDYELLLAVPPGREAALRAANVSMTRIGHFQAGEPGISAVAADGSAVPLGTGGWSHF